MMSVTEESKSVTVKYDDLEMAYLFVSDTYEIDAAAYVSRKTGKIFWESTELDDEFSSTAPATIPGWKAAIIDYFHEVGVTAEYEYDFGDGWVHEVVLEGILVSDQDMQYPLCIGGERACPVEDCGGVHGYDRLLCVLSSPDNEEYEELLIWLGKKFDPDEFAQDTVVFDDPKARWEKAFQNN